MAPSMLERELLVAGRQRDLLREAEIAGSVRGRPLRERVAAGLIALALRLAPTARDAVATGQVAAGATR